MKILLVDDDAFLRDMYVAKFQEAGHAVSAVDSVDAALALLEKGAFDIVLSDVVMPDIDGFGFLERIKAASITVPVVILSNQSESADRERANELGALDYIVKAEMVPGEVVARVEALLTNT